MTLNPYYDKKYADSGSSKPAPKEYNPNGDSYNGNKGTNTGQSIMNRYSQTAAPKTYNPQQKTGGGGGSANPYAAAIQGSAATAATKLPKAENPYAVPKAYKPMPLPGGVPGPTVGQPSWVKSLPGSKREIGFGPGAGSQGGDLPGWVKLLQPPADGEDSQYPSVHVPAVRWRGVTPTGSQFGNSGTKMAGEWTGGGSNRSRPNLPGNLLDDSGSQVESPGVPPPLDDSGSKVESPAGPPDPPPGGGSGGPLGPPNTPPPVGAPPPAGDRSLDQNPDGSANYDNIAARWRNEARAKGQNYDYLTADMVRGYHEWVYEDLEARKGVDVVDWLKAQGYGSPAAGRQGSDTYAPHAPQPPPGGNGNGGNGNGGGGGLDASIRRPVSGGEPGGGADGAGGTGTPGQQTGNPYLDGLMQSIRNQFQQTREQDVREFKHQGSLGNMQGFGGYSPMMGNFYQDMARDENSALMGAMTGSYEADAGRTLQRYLGDLGADTQLRVSQNQLSAAGKNASAQRAMANAQLAFQQQQAGYDNAFRDREFDWSSGYQDRGLDADIFGNLLDYNQGMIGWLQEYAASIGRSNPYNNLPLPLGGFTG